MFLWFYGFMVLWFYGFMVLWFYGFMVLWFHGFMVLWFLIFDLSDTNPQFITNGTHFLTMWQTWILK